MHVLLYVRVFDHALFCHAGEVSCWLTGAVDYQLAHITSDARTGTTCKLFIS